MTVISLKVFEMKVILDCFESRISVSTPTVASAMLDIIDKFVANDQIEDTIKLYPNICKELEMYE